MHVSTVSTPWGAQSMPRLVPWRKWSLDEECSTRPVDIIYVACEAFLLVATKQTVPLEGLLEEVLKLQLILRFAATLQKEYKPTERQQGVLYNWWQSGLKETIPADANPLETKFYQYGGIRELAALGSLIATDISVANDINTLPERQVVNIIHFIKGFPSHASFDKVLEKVPFLNSREDKRYSFFQRQVQKTRPPEPQPCPRCRALLEPAQHLNAKVSSTLHAQKRKRVSSPDANPEKNACSSSIREVDASNGAFQPSNRVPVHAWLQSQKLIHQPVAPNKDECTSPLQSKAGSSVPLIVSSASSATSILPLAEALLPVNTLGTSSQLPVEQRGELMPGLAAVADTTYLLPPRLEHREGQSHTTGTQWPEVQLRDSTTEFMQEHDTTYSAPPPPVAHEVPRGAEEQEGNGDWTRNHFLAHWKAVELGDTEAEYMPGQCTEYSGSVFPVLADEQEESSWTLSHSLSQWKEVRSGNLEARYKPGQGMEYPGLAFPAAAEEQKESGDWTISHNTAQWKAVHPRDPEVEYMPGQCMGYSGSVLPALADEQEESSWTRVHAMTGHVL